MPAKKFGSVVLANSNMVDAHDAVIEIASIYLENEPTPGTPSPSDETPAAAAPPPRR